MKRILIITAAIFAALTAFGQQPQALPNDPAVKVGKLENGLTYYIRHNDKPAQRAEFYLATDVGAFQEEDDQDGLAHFLEHMCFNGTKNFPGKSLLEWLQSIGAEFGANINASTGFEETSYMLNNIPLARESIIDSCLLVLHDYSHFVLCQPEEIDAERGVILEEKRTRNNAGWRMAMNSLPYYYAGTPYAKRTLIGSEEQLKTFRYESLTSFYHKWYHPDMQAVIVVGDIDVDKVESKIKEIFSDVPAPAVPTSKPVYELSQHAEPVIGIITDKEATSSSFDILWKTAPMPKEIRNTDMAYMVDLLGTFAAMVMNERFSDITARPDAPFLSAYFYPSSLCNSSDAMFGGMTFKDGDAVNALAAYMTEIEKMKRFGFTEAELQRAKDEIISQLEKAVEASDTRNNSDHVRPLLRHFYDNQPFIAPETELEIAKAYCAQISADMLRQMLPQLYPTFYAGENAIVLYNGPEKEGLVNPEKGEIAAVLDAVKNAEIQANAEESVNEPLISGRLKGSKVKKSEEILYGAVEWTLKNGVKVVVLPTEHKKDQVLMTLTMDGGGTLIATEDRASFEDNIWKSYLGNTGVSDFPATKLRKMLAGKQVSVSPYISSVAHGISGQSAPKDIETALQLMYLYFTAPRFDEDEYQAGIAQIKAVLPNIVNTPDYKFQLAIDEMFYGDNPRVVNLTEETLANADLATIERVYRSLFHDAAGARLTIVGNVDTESLRPLVEKYIGSLPKGRKASEINRENILSFVKGENKNVVKTRMQAPKVTVLQLYSAYMPTDTKSSVALDAANYILDMIYTRTIREQEGGTYGVGVFMDAQRIPEERSVIQVYFDTNPDQAVKLNALAEEHLRKFAENGPTAEEFSMAVENLKKNIPESRISNSYWMNAIGSWYRFGIDVDTEYEAAVNSLTPEDVKTVLQKLLAQGNRIELMLAPEE